MLLDTASLYFRAFYGVPDSLKAPNGTPVNAVRGLLDIIARLVTDFEPTHLVACWDDDWRPQWRVDLIPSYKAHRVEAVVPGGVDVEETPDPLDVQVPRHPRGARAARHRPSSARPSTRPTTSSARSRPVRACPSTSSRATATCSSSSTTRHPFASSIPLAA